MPTCPPVIRGLRGSSTHTRRGTAVASRSASSTQASRSTIRACSPPARASGRSSTGSRARTRSPTATRRGSTCGPGQRRVVLVERLHLHGARCGLVPHRRLPRVEPGFGGESATASPGGDLNRRRQLDMFAVLWNDDRSGLVGHRRRTVRSPTRPRCGTTRSTSTSAYFGTDNPATAVADRCRSSSRPTARTSTSTSASSRARMALTSRASLPATGCSAANERGCTGAKIVSRAPACSSRAARDTRSSRG